MQKVLAIATAVAATTAVLTAAPAAQAGTNAPDQGGCTVKHTAQKTGKYDQLIKITWRLGCASGHYNLNIMPVVERTGQYARQWDNDDWKTKQCYNAKVCTTSHVISDVGGRNTYYLTQDPQGTDAVDPGYPAESTAVADCHKGIQCDNTRFYG